jgi:hypothetical protein
MMKKRCLISVGSLIILAICLFLLESCNTQVDVNMQISSLSNVVVTFNNIDDVAVSHGSTLHLSVNETFDSYAWSLDGTILGGQANANLDIDSGQLRLGVHHLCVFVGRSGELYSKTLRFSVTY